MNNKTLTTGITGALIILLCILLCIAFSSCEKEPQNRHIGEVYLGTITYNIPNDTDTTTAANRMFYNHFDECERIKWISAPQVECFTKIIGDSYTIHLVTLDSYPTCNGVKIHNQFVFYGTGKFVNDSLFEEGYIIHNLMINTPFEKSIRGTWSAKFKKLH